MTGAWNCWMYMYINFEHVLFRNEESMNLREKSVGCWTEDGSEASAEDFVFRPSTHLSSELRGDLICVKFVCVVWQVFPNFATRGQEDWKTYVIPHNTNACSCLVVNSSPLSRAINDVIPKCHSTTRDFLHHMNACSQRAKLARLVWLSTGVQITRIPQYERPLICPRPSLSRRRRQ